MLRRLRPRSVYDVFAVLALFVALGGTSAVALSGSNTVFSDDIANDNFNSPTEGQGGLVASDLRAGSVAGSEVADGSLTGNDVFNNTIAGADITNGSLTGADVFDNTIGGADVTNNSLTGSDVNEASLNLAAEPWHAVGAAGEPAFGETSTCRWQNFSNPNFNTAAFLRDRLGFVHLKGIVDAEDIGAGPCGDSGGDPVIFHLPAGYRPAKREVHVTLTNSQLGRIAVDGPNLGLMAGAVSWEEPTTWPNAKLWISLDGISFRCAPSGSDGCP
jgi:hypothetical protein